VYNEFNDLNGMAVCYMFRLIKPSSARIQSFSSAPKKSEMRLLCSYVLPVRLSVRMKQLVSDWVNFHENFCGVLLRLVDKIQFWL
jgi:hypothetical protein